MRDVVATLGAWFIYFLIWLFGRKAAEASVERYDPSNLASAQIALTFDPPEESDTPA